MASAAPEDGEVFSFMGDGVQGNPRRERAPEGSSLAPGPPADIVDFYCPECRLIIELDGEAHTGLIAMECDDRRTRFFAEPGSPVRNSQVFDNRECVLETIQAVIRARPFGSPS